MKKFLVIFIALALMPLVLAQTSIANSQCNLDTTLIYQDPLPAQPGEYVELVFQVTGATNPGCGQITFELLEEYPLDFDKGDSNTKSITSSIFVQNFKSVWNVPFEPRIDKNALEGNNKIRTRITTASQTLIKNFTININDVRTDFEVFIRDYNPQTNMITFEILNIGENDIDALTVEIPPQENIDVKATRRNIVGSLDANEDTTFTFEAIPRNGNINLNVYYTDAINERRLIQESVNFDSSLYEGRGENNGLSIWFYLFIALLLIIIGTWVRKRWKRKKRHEKNN